MPLLDMAEAADFFRDCRKPDREVMVLWREPLEDLTQQGFVIADQGALGLAFGAVAERIERGAGAPVERQEPA